jgi:HIV Tat-specific factor 1
VVVESRIVVLKHMFTLQELKDDPSLLLDLKEDVREEAESVGDVTNVVLYDVSI